MQINLNTNNNETNFKALYLHKGCKMGNTYSKNLNIINYVKSDLEKMAQDVDIHVGFHNILNKGFDISVGEKVESPLKRAFGKIGLVARRFFCPGDYLQRDVIDVLMDTVKEAKEEYTSIISKYIV